MGTCLLCSPYHRQGNVLLNCLCSFSLYSPCKLLYDITTQKTIWLIIFVDCNGISSSSQISLLIFFFSFFLLRVLEFARPKIVFSGMSTFYGAFIRHCFYDIEYQNLVILRRCFASDAFAYFAFSNCEIGIRMK